MVFGKIWSWILSGLQFIWFWLWYWIKLFFVLPIKSPEVLWILIPIWVNLIFTDFFQEKRGTSMGNAITNGAVMLWVGVDWIRFLTRTSPDDIWWMLTIKYTLCAIVIIVGFTIIIEGVKGKEIIRKIARVRTTGYLMLMLSLIIYGVKDLTVEFLLVIIIFFPVFYFIFEFIDQKMPSPIESKDSIDKF